MKLGNGLNSILLIHLTVSVFLFLFVHFTSHEPDISVHFLQVRLLCCNHNQQSSTLDQLQYGLRCRWECGRNKLQSIPILLPSVNVGLEMVGFGLSQDVYIDGMYNWQTKRFSFMISPFVWYLMSMQSVNRPFSIFVTLVSYANILLMMLQRSLFMPS